MTDRDQVANAIVEVLNQYDVEDFVQPDWTDRTTEQVMRRLVAIGALPKECSPEHEAP